MLRRHTIYRWLRSIYVLSNPTTVYTADGEPDLGTIRSNVNNAQRLQVASAIEVPQFKPLGIPPSILSVYMPASLPIHIRRRSLVSIFGIGENSSLLSVKSSLESIHCISRIFYGMFPFLYQRIMSTVPFSVLVSSVSRRVWPLSAETGRAFATISLNGASDWALLNKSCLQVYSGAALSISMHRYPIKVSHSLAKQIKIPSSTPTGLSRWLNLGYTFLSGKGFAAITGKGSIYSLEVASGEELVLSLDNVLAISVAGPLDLDNCIAKFSLSPNFALSLEKTVSFKEPWIKAAINLRESPMHAFRVTIQAVYYWIGKIWSLLLDQPRLVHNFLVGDQSLVRIIGPRTILLQSSTEIGHIHRSSIYTKTPTPEVSSIDYLNYVKIQPGKGAVFQSAPNFQATVEEIKMKMK